MAHVADEAWSWRGARDHHAAMRPRGRAEGGPRKAMVVHRAQTRGRRPRVSTRVHVDAREGRHMARRLASEGPTG